MVDTFVLFGIGGVWNYGCEAIVRGTTALLEEAFPGCQVTLISSRPEYDTAALADTRLQIVGLRPRYGVHRGVRKLLRRLGLPWRQILAVSPRVFRRATCMLSIGGDIYTPHALGLPQETLDVEEAVLRMGRPVALWGATVGPFEDGTPDGERMRGYLQRVLLVAARESISMEYLRRVAVLDHSMAIADPAFLVESQEFDITTVAPRAPAEFLVGFNLSPLLGRYLKDGAPGTILDLGVTCVQALLKCLPVRIALVPHVVRTVEDDDDHQLLSRIAERVGPAGGRLTVLPPDLHVRKTKYLLSQCDAVAAARMHCAILSLASHVPAVSISYSLKSLGVLGDVFEDDRWVIRLKDLTPDLLVQRVRAALAQRQEIRHHLETAVPKLQDKARYGMQELKRRLAAHGPGPHACPDRGSLAQPCNSMRRTPSSPDDMR